MSARASIARLDRRLYPGVRDNWDDELFRSKILEVLTPTSRVLDIGAGAGIVPHMDFRGRAAEIFGIDLDPRVLENPYLDGASVASGEDIPHEDASFDVVYCDNVLEHLADPLRVFAEVRRVLRVGGVFLAKTPNKYHYMPLVARLTPTALHKRFNRMRGRDGADTFPTLYRANSAGDLRRLARDSGLTVVSVDHVEGRPEYLRFSAPTYFAGWAYERIVNRVPGLGGLRILLVAVFRRPA